MKDDEERISFLLRLMIPYFFLLVFDQKLSNAHYIVHMSPVKY